MNSNQKDQSVISNLGLEFETKPIKEIKSRFREKNEKGSFLENLNIEQRAAVEKIFGTVLVIAGPGTGKTQMLTARIAHILQNTDTSPWNILCLTFTESAATEMKTRLAAGIGNTAYQVHISTFHGFCEWVMRKYVKDFFPKRQNREVADDLQRALAFRDAVESQRWEHFSNVFDPFVWRTKFLRAISDLKRENISSAELRELIPVEKERLETDPENFYKRKFGEFQPGDFKPSARAKIDRKIGQMSELADLWEVYEQKLAERGFFDFDDQLMWVVTELQKNANLRADLQEQFQWVLVDEYQDTNEAQNQILWHLTDFWDEPNLFAVGDDDQAIYRFQGASSKNILDFQSRFPKRTEVLLQENYRSGQRILDTAFGFIAKNLDRISHDKVLHSAGKNKEFPGEIFKAELGSRYGELAFLVQQIRAELKSGTPPSEIAVLVRKNREVKEIARELPKFGIPIAAKIFEDIFEDENVNHLIRMLQIFADPTHDEVLIDVLHAPFFSIPGETLLQLSLDSKRGETPVIELLLERTKDDEFIAGAVQLLTQARKNYFHCRPAVIAEKLLYESGLANFVSNEKNEFRSHDWQKLKKFIDWIREQNLNDLPELLERIQLQKTLQIPVRPDPTPADSNAVQVMTAHRAKGREFDVVFIPGLLDKVWGNCRGQAEIAVPHIVETTHDENEDERRLFFVAVTRARKKVFLSYSTSDFSGRDRTASQFWYEVSDDLCQTFATDQVEAELQKLLPVFIATPDEPRLTEGEKNILREQVKRFVWSASSLQNYLDCPRKFLFQNLFRIPRRPTSSMALGTSMHAALEKFLRTFRISGKLPDDSELIAEFERSLRGQNIPTSDFQKLLEHGRDILKKYFHAKRESFSDNVELEKNFREHAPQIGGVPATGKIDKVEFLDEKKTRAVLVDYKSGKPRSIRRGEREWRQLVFYDLLVRNSAGISWNVTACVLEFLTPGLSGKFERKKLEISEEDRQQVISELQEANEKIQTLQFPFIPNPEGDSEIEYWQNFGR